MNANNVTETSDQPVRLRVETGGLSEATRRELGLGNWGGEDHENPADRESAGRDEESVPWPAAAREAKRVTQTEVGAGAPLPPLAVQTGQGEENWRAHGVGTNVEAAAPEVNQGGIEQNPVQEKPAAGGGPEPATAGDRTWLRPGRAQSETESGGQRREAGVKIAEPAVPGAGQEADGKNRKPERESFGEGFTPTRAGGSTMLRPGRARSGEEATRQERAPEVATERPQAEEEEGRRWQALQVAVSQHTSRQQQMFGTMMQALRDAARLHMRQQAELERLGEQVRRLTAQNAEAGFNRQ